MEVIVLEGLMGAFMRNLLLVLIFGWGLFSKTLLAQETKFQILTDRSNGQLHPSEASVRGPRGELIRGSVLVIGSQVLFVDRRREDGRSIEIGDLKDEDRVIRLGRLTKESWVWKDPGFLVRDLVPEKFLSLSSEKDLGGDGEPFKYRPRFIFDLHGEFRVLASLFSIVIRNEIKAYQATASRARELLSKRFRLKLGEQDGTRIPFDEMELVSVKAASFGPISFDYLPFELVADRVSAIMQFSLGGRLVYEIPILFFIQPDGRLTFDFKYPRGLFSDHYVALPFSLADESLSLVKRASWWSRGINGVFAIESLARACGQ